MKPPEVRKASLDGTGRIANDVPGSRTARTARRILLDLLLVWLRSMIVSWLRNRRRRRLLEQPFPDTWRDALRANFPQFERLGTDQRARLEGVTRILVAEKYWEGCRGFEVTDEVRVTIAAQAGLLLLGFEREYFDRLKSVLVYPDPYMATATQQLPGGVVQESRQMRLGEAWHRGPVVLAWSDVLEGGRHPDDGKNVVFHEFAHVLDMQDDVVDGTPFLEETGADPDWAHVMQAAYRRLRRDVSRGRRTLLDAYGMENEAEFFAVATEVFFERPQAMRHDMPNVYEVLSRFYRQDPAGWSG